MVQLYKMTPISYDIVIFRSVKMPFSYSIRKLGAVIEQFP
jgi:hypothetical protein